MEEKKVVDLRMTVYASLFAALISAGAFIAIPVGPVPIVLQNMFVLLAGVMLGWKWGAGSVLVYLLAGAIGFPVFSAGRGGLVHILGPTGGYLLGYIPAVIVAGVVSTAFARGDATLKKRIFGNISGMVLGSVFVYSIGVSWLKVVTGMAWGKSIGVGVLPFLVGDVIKIAVAAYIAELVKPVIKR